MPQTVEILSGPLEGMSFAIGEGQSLSLGRSGRNDVVMAHDPWISSAHGILRNQNRQLSLMDLGSSNGSFVDGKKIEPKVNVDLGEFFVIGSTLCRVCEEGRVVPGEPLSLNSKEANLFLAQPLIQAARRLARDRRSQIVGAIHLFFAIIEFEHPDVIRFIRGLRRDPVDLRHRLDRLEIFSGARAWINDFLAYQHKPLPNRECFLTPLVQDLFREKGFAIDFDLTAFLKVLLTKHYNLLFPLFGLKDGDHLTRKIEGSERSTIKPMGAAKMDTVLPARFWNALNTELVHGHIVLLSGGKGIGKTTILKQCFHSLLKVDISHFKPDKNYFFDPKLFLIFNEWEALPEYVASMINALASDRVIAIDHFGYLLRLLREQKISPGPLIEAINRRSMPVLLGIGVDYAGHAEKLLRKPSKIHLEDYLDKVSPDQMHQFLEDFEQKANLNVSSAAEDELVKVLLPQYGLEGIESFFGFCAERLRHFNLLHRELAWRSEKQTKRLSKAFFHAMLREWEASNEPEPLPRSNKLNMAEPPAADFNRRVDQMLSSWVAKHFRWRIPGDLKEDKPADPALKAVHLAMRWKALVSSLDEAFSHWFRAFMKEIDPLGRLENDPRAQADQIRRRYLEHARDLFRKKLGDKAQDSE